MIIYCVHDGAADPSYFGSKREALKKAREWAEGTADPQPVTACTVSTTMTKKQLLLAILNQQGWASEQVLVTTVQPSAEAVRRCYGAGKIPVVYGKVKQ